MTLSSALGATKEEKLEKLFSNLPRNAFPTAVEMSSGYQPGVFSWDAKHVHFDYIGMGKPQRLTVTLDDVKARDENGWHWHYFGPSPKDQNVGERTEYVGTAHSVHNSPLWRKKAWNTLNEWCTTFSNGNMPSILRIMDLARDCYARLTFGHVVDYLVPDEQMVGPHPIDEGRAMRLYLAQALRTMHIVDDPRWYRSPTLTSEQEGYLSVAWDEYVESGGSRRAPLRGLR